METPFTTLRTKGETGSCSAVGLFQDATMGCVREKRSLASRSGLKNKTKKNSSVILEGFF